MSALLLAKRSAVRGRAGAVRLLAPIALLLSTALLASGCTAPPPPLAGANPVDPASHVAAVGYRSTLSGYRSQRPVEPGSWIEQNQRVAPSDSKQ
jgi:hypothetical protein